MHEAALQADDDPDRLSFLHAVRVVCRKLPFHDAIPPRQQARLRQAALQAVLEERVNSSRGRRNQRVVKRNMSSFPKKRGSAKLPPIRDIQNLVKILN